MLSYQTIQTLVTLLRMFFDILIMWILLYYTIKLVRNNSRTTQIFKGIFLILLVRAFANFFGLKTVAWLSDIFVTWGFLAIIIIFQPEIRGLLEKLGKTSMFSRISTLSGNERLRLIEELEKSVEHLSATQTGALITLEQGHSLNDFIHTGTIMNSNVTSELLTSIFVTTTPLHDGAVIIQGDRIACASAYFPPTNLDLPTRYGARHRAAIGISEITDSITIVVSEQSGRVSIAFEGKLTTMTKEMLHEYLEKTILHTEKDVHNTKDKGMADVPKAPAEPIIKVGGEAETTRIKKITDLFKHEPKPKTKKTKPAGKTTAEILPLPEMTPDTEQDNEPVAAQPNDPENLLDELLADVTKTNTKEKKTVVKKAEETDKMIDPSDTDKGGDA
ncbi:MAG: diadenylate cyclase CdaA [Erysipelotrichaceae bacterium]